MGDISDQVKLVLSVTAVTETECEPRPICYHLSVATHTLRDTEEQITLCRDRPKFDFNFGTESDRSCSFGAVSVTDTKHQCSLRSLSAETIMHIDRK